MGAGKRHPTDLMADAKQARYGPIRRSQRGGTGIVDW
jgi:hypothetical protein